MGGERFESFRTVRKIIAVGILKTETIKKKATITEVSQRKLRKKCGKQSVWKKKLDFFRRRRKIL